MQGRAYEFSAEHRSRAAARHCARRRHRACGNSWCASTAFSPYVLPGPVLGVSRRWSAIGRCCHTSLGVTLLTTLEGFCRGPRSAASRWPLLFNQSKWLEYSLFPYAVILQVTPVIAIAPLLLIYLQQQTAVIVCAWIVAFLSGAVQHHARAQLGRPQSGRAVSALWRLAAADAALISNCRPAPAVYCSADCGSPAACP